MIRLNKLSKKYGDDIIFDDFDLVIEKGEFICITGASGRGKSTLLNIIGLIDPDYQGEVQINGINISQLKGEKKQKFIRENINYLFQNYALVDDETVEYNLKIALKYRKLSSTEKSDIIQSVLEDVNLADKKDKKIHTLSGGEQQRISMARSLIKTGNILLADEPTGNLDSLNRDIILSLFRKYHNNDKIIIIASHDKFVIDYCDFVFNL